MDFTHLHVHSEYSALDGINKVKALAKRAKDNGMSAVSLTDHGVCSGLVEFYKACKKEEVKPVMGLESYITKDKDNLDNPEKNRDNYHCVLLAKNQKGLENLFWLNSQAHLNNFYYRPRIWVKHLEDHSEGLIANSACLGGILGKQVTFDEETKKITDGQKQVLKTASYFKGIFGEDFYLEIQDNKLSWEQDIYNQLLIEVGKKLKIKTIISADAHYLTLEEQKKHTFTMAMQMKCSVEDYMSIKDSARIYEGAYVRTPEEMLAAAIRHDSEESFHNTLEIAEKCNAELTLGEYQMPQFDPECVEDIQEFESWEKVNQGLINECIRGS